MMNLQDAIGFVSKIRAYTILTDTAKRNKFIELYQYIFNEVPVCEGCTGDIENAIHKMLVHLRKNEAHDPTTLLKETDMSHYKLKPNVRYYSSTMKMYVTRYNLTDAVAERIIQENPSCVDLFETIPAAKPVEAEKVETQVASDTAAEAAVENRTIQPELPFGKSKKRKGNGNRK
jgi:hypothetical protein